jgi:hypothetical protein
VFATLSESVVLHGPSFAGSASVIGASFLPSRVAAIVTLRSTIFSATVTSSLVMSMLKLCLST